MKKLNIQWVYTCICLGFMLIGHTAQAILYEFDSDKEIADWELGPQATAKVKDGMLELTVAGGQKFGYLLWGGKLDGLPNGSQGTETCWTLFSSVCSDAGTSRRFLFHGNQLQLAYNFGFHVSRRWSE